MAHPKAVPVVLNGETKHLVYDINALCALRDEGVDYALFKDADFTDPRLLRKLVWAALLHESPDLSLRDVGAWLDMENLLDVSKATTTAFLRSSGRELESAGDPQTPRSGGRISSEAATAS